MAHRLIGGDDMVASLFAGPFSFLALHAGRGDLRGLRLVQTACTDSTAGQAIRSICHRWFGSKNSGHPES